MFGEIVLTLWSVAGLGWWLLAWRLVASASGKRTTEPTTTSQETISIFKPLPPLGAQGLRLVAGGLESFLAQLDAKSELLLGIHETDHDFTGPFLKRLRTDYPHARLKIIFRTESDDVANPKIAWQKILARHAEGEWWLWSDADIIVPANFLQSVRGEFARADAKMMTFPYIVREVPTPPTLLEALFVNVDFYPGVLLLRERGAVDFGLGAAMLFRRDDFLNEVGWDDIGDWLADDFFLGQKLQPVAIGQCTVATVSGSQSWTEALLHDLRWAKTIRWNRPLGSFSRILVLPVLGWLGAVAVQPSHYFAWAGLAGMVQADVLFACLICRSIGCGLAWEDICRMELWSLWRVGLWFSSWLPWPVLWSGKAWYASRANHMVKSA